MWKNNKQVLVHLVFPNSTTTYIETHTNHIGTLPLDKKGGRLDSCIPTNNGHYYSSKNVIAWDPTGWVGSTFVAAPPVSHHLN